MTEQQFIDKFMGKFPMGLDKSTADKLIAMGKDYCDFFEATYLSMMYQNMKDNKFDFSKM